MPVLLNAKYPGPERRSGLNWPRVQPGAFAKPCSTYLHIGLVNNMADAALVGTEDQFLGLLEAAAGDMPIRVTLYTLPKVMEGDLDELLNALIPEDQAERLASLEESLA